MQEALYCQLWFSHYHFLVAKLLHKYTRQIVTSYIQWPMQVQLLKYCSIEAHQYPLASPSSHWKCLRSYILLAKIEDFFEPELDTYVVPAPTEKVKHDPRYYCPAEWKLSLVEHCRLHYLANVWEAFSYHYLMPDSPPTALLNLNSKGCVFISGLFHQTWFHSLRRQ